MFGGDGWVLAERRIPVPTSVSHQAQSGLSEAGARAGFTAPATDDIAGWRAAVADITARMAPYVAMFESHPDLDVGVEQIGAIDVHVVARKGEERGAAAKINLLMHGGGWVFGGGRSTVLPAGMSALNHGGVVYAPDYRLAPDHPFPAGLEDCLLVYRALVARFDPARILVSGESAGGNLAAALLFKIRSNGLPMPGSLFLNTPALDLTFASDTIHTNLGVDVTLNDGLREMAALYLRDADPRDPLASPLYGDFSSGFPPTYLRSGTRDLLLSDTVRMHAALRKAGVDADLYVGEAMPHGGFIVLGKDTPEDQDARADLGRWLQRCWPAPMRAASDARR